MCYDCVVCGGSLVVNLVFAGCVVLYYRYFWVDNSIKACKFIFQTHIEIAWGQCITVSLCSVLYAVNQNSPARKQILFDAFEVMGVVLFDISKINNWHL